MERRFAAISVPAPFENTGSKDVFNTCMQNESTVAHKTEVTGILGMNRLEVQRWWWSPDHSHVPLIAAASQYTDSLVSYLLLISKAAADFNMIQIWT